jgi:phosphate transport system protein
MNVSEHTARVFDTDLIKLTQMVAQMGGFAQKQITDSIDALTRRDIGLARQVIAADASVDALQRQIEEKAIATIALRQPMAIDLRALVAMLRIANDLERVGDLAKNIGKRVIAVSGDNSQRALMRGLKHMAALVVSQLAAVLDSFVDRDPGKALQVWKADKEVDALYVSLFRELLTY